MDHLSLPRLGMLEGAIQCAEEECPAVTRTVPPEGNTAPAPSPPAAQRPASATLPRWVHAHEPILVLGIATEVVYLLYFVQRFPLLRDYRMPFGAFAGPVTHMMTSLLGVLGWQFLLFGAAWWVVREWEDPTTVRLVLAFGAIFAVTMVFVYPMMSPDAYEYIAGGRVLWQYHHNPLTIPLARFPHDSIIPLTNGLGSTAIPYGPLGIVVDSLPTLVTGGHLLANLLLLKFSAAGFMLADALLAYRIVRRWQPRGAVGAALLLAWNPMLLLQICANGHNDGAMMLFILLAVLAVGQDRLALGPLLLVLSALVKYATLLLVPLFLIYGMAQQPTRRQQFRYVALTAALMLVVVIVAFAPFWAGANTLQRALMEDQLHSESFSASLHELLSGRPTIDLLAAIGRLLFLPVYGYAHWLSRRRPVDLTRGSVLTLFTFLALAAGNVRGWYAIWPVAPAALLPRAAERIWLIVLSFLATAGNLLWLDGPFSSLIRGLGWFNALPYLLTFLPTTLALIILAVIRRGPAPPASSEAW